MGRPHPRSRGSLLLEEWRGTRLAAEMCALIGIDAATYSRFANGLRKPTGPIAYRIAKLSDGFVPVESWQEAGAVADKPRARAS